MDLTQMPLPDPTAVAGTLALLGAAGGAVAGLTEAVKYHFADKERQPPPPLVAAIIAILFTIAWYCSLPGDFTRFDAFPALISWYALFNASIGVYHATKIATKGKAEASAAKRVKAAVDATRTAYDRILDEKDKTIEQLRDDAVLRTMTPAVTGPGAVPTSVPPVHRPATGPPGS